MPQPKINVPADQIAEFCKRNHIVKLSLFGSVLRDDFSPESDIDVMVEFDPAHVPGLIRLAGMEIELSKILGRKADMNTPQDLSRYFRDKVLAQAQVQYARA
ncbi:MAG: nucleotidyltransferase family protein [Chloroflexi bacterium]|nr:nucleotidyltransferase family protein [Chloroflexota bacterium]MBI3763206.1 nucleotidyltransferase family protein [Chloroflexota bacterium]